ncbi:hypothetical protein HPB47_011342 [Ixodes persulcatus]|uniref:Uncharacterized protein n=1 Tax=Ixodes persulcatus TaxID=34615 RepID=A0AC60NWI8_IXOPE|nr:hypothetical protein HPB47_011342 [Ixodes persulcatus]
MTGRRSRLGVALRRHDANVAARMAQEPRLGSLHVRFGRGHRADFIFGIWQLPPFANQAFVVDSPRHLPEASGRLDTSAASVFESGSGPISMDPSPGRTLTQNSCPIPGWPPVGDLSSFRTRRARTPHHGPADARMAPKPRNGSATGLRTGATIFRGSYTPPHLTLDLSGCYDPTQPIERFEHAT